MSGLFPDIERHVMDDVSEGEGDDDLTMEQLQGPVNLFNNYLLHPSSTSFSNSGVSQSSFDEDASEYSIAINPSILDNIDEYDHQDRFFYTKLYNDYKSSRLQPEAPQTSASDSISDISDFETFNQKTIMEQKLAFTIRQLQSEKRIKSRKGTISVVSNVNDDFMPMETDESRLSKTKKLARFLPVPDFLLRQHRTTSKKVENLSPILTNRTQIIDDDMNQAPVDLQNKSRKPHSNKVYNYNMDSNSHVLVNEISLNFNSQSILNNYDPGAEPHRNELQRKLAVRHLQMIAFGGTLGVGLFLSSGKAFSIAGPLGAILGFLIAGTIVLATMVSYCEMITLISVAGGLSGICSRFVDDAFGFSLSFIYWINYAVGLPTEIVAATIMLSYYDDLDVPNGRYTALWILAFIVMVVGINLFDVRVYGEIEYISSLIKLVLLFTLVIFMIVLNRGAVPPKHELLGFKYWKASQSDIGRGFTYGPFRPTFDLNDAGNGSLNGIGGGKGRFLSVIVAVLVATYSYIGTEIVLIAAGEAKNPKRALPSATRRIFWRIVIFYIVSIFVVGLNLYSGDPRLLRYLSSNSDYSQLIANNTQQYTYCRANFLLWNGFSNGNQSPWIIALQSASLCGFASVLNGLLVFFALSAGSSQLYASSRTLYYLSIQGKAPKVFSTCSKAGVPYVSVLMSGSLACLSFMVVTQNTANVFQKLMNVCATSGMIVWTGMNLTFIRFYYGLKLRPDIISRDDPSYPYRSPFQPFTAIYGLVSGGSVVLLIGFVVFMKGHWDTVFFVTSYGSLLLFIFCYLGYKFIRRTKIHKLDQLDFDTGRREMDKVIWEEDKIRNKKTVKEFAKTLIQFLA